MTITSSNPELSALAQQYAEEGFVLVKGLLSKEEAAHYRQRSHDLLARLNRTDDPTWASARDMTEAPTRLQHLHDAQFYDAEFSKLLVDPRFTDVAAAVMGVDNVQLHHTKLFVKPPENGSPFPLHQDHPFFPHTYHRVGRGDLPLRRRAGREGLRPGHPGQPQGRSAGARPGGLVPPARPSVRRRRRRSRPRRATYCSSPT